MPTVDVIDDAAVAAVALDPLRARILAALAEPGSASTVAAALGLSRQLVNYHLRHLEDAGLVRFVEMRQRRGLAERRVVASAQTYVLAPDLLSEAVAEPARADRWSAAYLVAVAARAVREVAGLASSAQRAGKPLATLTIDLDIRFADAQARAAFTDELAASITLLAARYHDEAAAGGRWHRLLVGAYPRPAAAQRATKER